MAARWRQAMALLMGAVSTLVLFTGNDIYLPSRMTATATAGIRQTLRPLTFALTAPGKRLSRNHLRTVGTGTFMSWATCSGSRYSASLPQYGHFTLILPLCNKAYQYGVVKPQVRGPFLHPMYCLLHNTYVVVYFALFPQVRGPFLLSQNMQFI